MANRKWIVGALAAALWVLPAAAQTSGAAQEQPMGGTGAKSKAAKKQLTNADIRALTKLHAVNEEEIAAGNWMKEHATNDKVKEFASTMVDDHQNLDSELTSFAQERGTDLTSAPKPSGEEKHARELDRLKAMSGAQADRQYMRMMVQGHEQALKEARAAERTAKRSKNTELASVLTSASDKIDGHLKDARQIQKELGQRQARMPRR